MLLVPETLQQLKQAIKDLNDVRAKELTQKALAEGISPLLVIEQGLADPLREIGEMFGRGDVFLTDLVAGAAAMEAAMEIVGPAIEKSGEKRVSKGKLVIGTVEGDIHDIGKNIVSSMIKANGFDVYDLGKDVPCSRFAEKTKEVNPGVVGASALLTSTLPKQEDLVKLLAANGLREKVKVIVGGAPASSAWAQKINADGYAPDAAQAVDLVKKLFRA